MFKIQNPVKRLKRALIALIKPSRWISFFTPTHDQPRHVPHVNGH